MKNNYITYNIKSILRTIIPNGLFKSQKKRILKNWEYREDVSYIKDRVNYYCKLDELVSLGEDSKAISDIRFGNKKTVYLFDTYEYTRFFPQHLKANFAFGDVNYFLKYPSITKSRPIYADSKNEIKSKNSILLNLDKIRHFTFINDPYKFSDKKDLLFYRGGVYQKHREEFFEKYFNHYMCDIAHIGKPIHKEWAKKKISIKKHLPYKFLLSLEGNDVASNLKWIMSSNSLAIMPKPKFETWFMEGRLKEDYHYVRINDDYSNLEEKILFYMQNLQQAENIINNAHKYVKQFFDKKREDIISLLVLEKYFKYTGQL